MSYTALYRKWRPDNFDDVKGQEHIVTTLKNQIRSDRIGHAYLFCGTRGTGKTSVAKIFAKAVNCENPVDGSPCGECRSCRTIASGASMNVVEIDAASNNGVDNIREIREEVAYSPAEGKYKVYIIDEVHMLSMGAFNALLKTLEEPPSYVIFILATTEVHKIPITILSRCQRYDFRRISIETIAERLRHLMEEEQVQVEERALRYVAKAADGSMRDALSLLDQCIAFYFGEELTYDKALQVLGSVDTEVFGRMLRLILDKNVSGVIHLLEELVIQGRELGQFVTDMTWYFRNLLLLKSSDMDEDVLDISSENMERLKEEATMLETGQLMRYIRIFSGLSGEIRYAAQKRILIEIALIKLCKPEMETDITSVLERVRDLERLVENGIPAAAAQPAQQAVAADALPAKRPLLPKAIPEDVKQAVEGWSGIVSVMNGILKTYLKNVRLSLGSDNVLQLIFQDENAFAYVNREEQKKAVAEQIAGKIGKEVELQCKLLESGRKFEDSYVDLHQLIHMDIEIEDE